MKTNDDFSNHCAITVKLPKDTTGDLVKKVSKIVSFNNHSLIKIDLEKLIHKTGMPTILCRNFPELLVFSYICDKIIKDYSIF